MTPAAIIANGFCLASAIGSAMLLWAAALILRRAGARDPAAPSPAPAISILKPLYGAEPRLFDNLASTLRQESYPAAVEMICGVSSADDPAIGIVQRLRDEPSAIPVRLVIGERRPWANAKITNLARIAAEAQHEMLVLADSDMMVPPDYLARLAGVLAQPGVGAVTCLYVGRGDAGFWSRLVAAGIDSHFLPASEIGLATGLANPCMGSTIALRRTTLDAIGGFAAFADVLADDHAIGAAVRATGQKVVVPALVLVHACAEPSLGALIRQELRWNATIAGIDRAGYAGSVVLHPLPLALMAWLAGGGTAAASLALLAIAARGAVLLGASGIDPFNRPPRDRLAALMLIPVRDLLSFCLFLTSFVVRTVDWRGAGLKLDGSGRLAPRKDIET